MISRAARSCRGSSLLVAGWWQVASGMTLVWSWSHAYRLLTCPHCAPPAPPREGPKSVGLSHTRPRLGEIESRRKQSNTGDSKAHMVSSCSSSTFGKGAVYLRNYRQCEHTPVSLSAEVCGQANDGPGRVKGAGDPHWLTRPPRCAITLRGVAWPRTRTELGLGLIELQGVRWSRASRQSPWALSQICEA